MSPNTCPECRAEVAANTNSCTACGAQYDGSKVIVHGNDQRFIMNPKVTVYWNGHEVGSVTKGQTLELPVADDGELSFSSIFRRASMHIDADCTTKILIRWNQFTGKMTPLVIE